MEQAGHFEKVSFTQYCADMKSHFDDSISALKGLYEAIRLPVRATAGSAGYDFVAPFSFILRPGEAVTIPTGIRVQMEPGWFLGCFPRSGLGSRYQMRLANTTGIVDSDYYYADNEGHIFARVVNGSPDLTLRLQAGDKFMQGVFIPFGVTVDDDATAARRGGMGSTGA